MKITDEMLYRHAAEARDIWLDTLPDDSEIPEHEFSDEFNKEMDRLIALSVKQKKPAKRFRRVAAMFAAVLIGASSFVAINAEARAAFVGWIKELTDDYLIYRYEGDPVPDVEPVFYRPTWIPEGYSEFLVDEEDDTKFLAYANEAGEMLKLSYIHNPDETDWFISTENTIKESTTVNGNKADLFISTDPDTSGGVIWSDENNCAFMLSGFLDVDDLLKMAESIRPVDPSELEKGPIESATEVQYGLTAIPEGYVEVLTDYDDNGGSQLFENEAGQYLTFLYTLNSGDSSMYIDTTSTTHYQTLFNGHKVDVMLSDDPTIQSSVAWVDDENTVFCVMGFFDAEGLFEIAESIEPIAMETTTPDLSSLNYRPTLIPEGYTWHRENDIAGSRRIVYKNEAGQLLRYHYVYDTASTAMFTVAEGSTHSIIDINGYQADMLLFDDPETSNCILWTDENNCAHAVHAFLDEAALIELAESVKVVD